MELAPESQADLFGPRARRQSRYLHLVETEWLDRLAGFRPGARVLDLGCGVGRLSRWLAARGLEVTGADRSREQIEVAREVGPAGVSYVPVTGFALPFPDASFDAALVRFPADAAAEVRRVLAPGGRAVVLTERAPEEPEEHEETFRAAGFTTEIARDIQKLPSAGFRLVTRCPVPSGLQRLLARREPARAKRRPERAEKLRRLSVFTR